MTSEIELWPDQQGSILDIRTGLLDHQSIVYQGECGSGKTVIAAYMAAGAQRKGKTVLFGVHRKELLRQTALTFDKFGIRYSFIASGMPYDPYATVQIVSADTICDKLHLCKGHLLVPDEAHLWCSPTRLAIVNEFKRHGGKIVNMTATPQRGNGQGLGAIASHIVSGPTARWLIDNERLADYKAWAPAQVDMTGAKKNKDGEYSESDLDEKLDKPYVYGDRIEAYRAFAYGTRMVGYCYSRENGIKTEAAFRAAGITCKFIDGTTPDSERRQAILDFANGVIMVLLNCQLIREGFDLSAQVGRHVPIQTVGLWTPSDSLPMAIQEMMRPLRWQGGAYARLLDHVGLLAKHGLPDEDREWDVDGIVKPKGDTEATIATSICVKCKFQARPFIKCPECGYEREIESREVEEIAGEEIVLVDIEAMRKAKHAAFVKSKIEERECGTDPVKWKALERERGHKPGWWRIQLKLRTRKKR